MSEDFNLLLNLLGLIVIGGPGCVIAFFINKGNKAIKKRTGIDIKNMIATFIKDECNQCDAIVKEYIDNTVAIGESEIEQMVWDIYEQAVEYECCISKGTKYCEDDEIIRLIRAEVEWHVNEVLLKRR